MERLIDRYGAYLGHLTALTEDSSVKGVDKQKIMGYIKQWGDTKALLGCAFFIDLLKQASILCKVLQDDEDCVYQAIESTMKTKKALNKLKAAPFKELPTIKKVLTRGKEETDGSFTYQGIEIKNYKRGMEYFSVNYASFVESVENCLRSRIKSRDTELLTHALTILATHGWEKRELPSFADPAIEAISKRFEVPLVKASVDISALTDEWEDMTGYAKQYLNLVLDYKVVWWKLFNAPVAKQWSNILAVVELLFYLPMANGGLEQVFSELKLIKTGHCTCLKEDALDQLLRIHNGPPLSEWKADSALELWLKEKARRINHKEKHRKQTKKFASVQDSGSEDDSEVFCLNDWENWLESESEENEVDQDINSDLEILN